MGEKEGVRPRVESQSLPGTVTMTITVTMQPWRSYLVSPSFIFHITFDFPHSIIMKIIYVKFLTYNQYFLASSMLKFLL